MRVCIPYSETDDEMENVVKDALKRRSRLHLARSIFLEYMKQRGAVLWLPGWPPTDRCSRAIAGRNDEVRRLLIR